jgi:uncharacterized protein (TIGR02246 family)
MFETGEMMKVIRSAGVLAFAVVCSLMPAVAQSAATPKANSPEAQEVLKVVRRFQEAGVRGDTTTLMQIFDGDVSHFHPGSPYRFIGAKRLADEFAAASKTALDMRFEMVDPDVVFAEKEVAVVTYYIVESWADKSGVRTNVKEKASEVYVRKEGAWKMIHGHYSVE